VVQFLYQDVIVLVQKLNHKSHPKDHVLVQKLNHKSHPKCDRKSPKTTRLLKSAVRDLRVSHTLVVYYESMKRKLIQNLYMSVGVMEDYKLRDLRASHTGLVVEHTGLVKEGVHPVKLTGFFLFLFE
jgi:hypothetical protein